MKKVPLLRDKLYKIKENILKNLTIDEFKNSMSSIIDDVVLCGEIYRIDTGKRIDKVEKGTFVIMEEPEYKIMREALQMVVSLVGIADKDGNININDLMKKTGILP